MAASQVRLSYTIGKLAQAAGVNVETVRYYQTRKLIAVPPRDGGFRYYPPEAVDRLRFIKRAQELGFSLDEIAEMLKLNDGTQRRSIRALAAKRLEQIEAKLGDLQRMRRVLTQLVAECEHSEGGAGPCPIIEAMTTDGRSKSRVKCKDC